VNTGCEIESFMIECSKKNRNRHSRNVCPWKVQKKM